MSQESATLLIPVKPYLHQFLTTSFGPSLSLNSNHIIGVFILVCIEGRRHTAYTQKKTEFQMASYTCEYPLILPPRKQHLNQAPLCPQNVIFINRLLDNFFDTQLYLHAEKQRANGKGRYFGHNQSLSRFLEKHCIEEDAHMTFESLRKREQRFKKKMLNVC